MTEYDPTCPATGWRPSFGQRDWRPPDCTCTGVAYHPFHGAVMIHGVKYVCPDEGLPSGRLSDEELARLARQVLLRQRLADA